MTSPDPGPPDPTTTIKLLPEIKAKWLAALRSGEYVQGVGALRARRISGGYAYCCLGVLCDIAAESNVGKWVDGGYSIGFDYSAGLLPAGVSVWAFTKRPDRGIEDNPHNLAGMNDRGVHFGGIADYIEANL